MKLWRDFKLLALCAGLLAVDGCQPKDSWDDFDWGCNFYGMLVGEETCNGARFWIVEGPPSYVTVQDVPCPGKIQFVAGQYRGRAYQRLVRYLIPGPPSASPNNRRFNVGDCGRFFNWPERSSPSCFSDQIETYLLNQVSPIDASVCTGIADPR
jgi:hypothetical protein